VKKGGVPLVVEVRLYATLRRYAPASLAGVFPAQVPVNCTVAELLNGINIEETEVHIMMINGVISTLNSTLHEGDRLGLFPAVGGG